MIDLISRQAVKDAYCKICLDRQICYRIKEHCEDLKVFDALPPVNPQPKTGHWFIDERPESDREVVCSACEQPIFKYHKLDFDYRPKFCPNCGARMVEQQESEE